MSQNKNYRVKHIQANLATLIHEGETLTIPQAWLPEQCKEGDVVRTLILDEEAKKRKAGLSSLLVFEVDKQTNKAQLERLKGLI